MNEVARVGPEQPTDAGGDTVPHNVEAEQQLLGAILTNNDIYDRVASIIGRNPISTIRSMPASTKSPRPASPRTTLPRR